jgi:hypothetical protein
VKSALEQLMKGTYATIGSASGAAVSRGPHRPAAVKQRPGPVANASGGCHIVLIEMTLLPMIGEQAGRVLAGCLVVRGVDVGGRSGERLVPRHGTGDEPVLRRPPQSPNHVPGRGIIQPRRPRLRDQQGSEPIAHTLQGRITGQIYRATDVPVPPADPIAALAQQGQHMVHDLLDIAGLRGSDAKGRSQAQPPFERAQYRDRSAASALTVVDCGLDVPSECEAKWSLELRTHRHPSSASPVARLAAAPMHSSGLPSSRRKSPPPSERPHG